MQSANEGSIHHLLGAAVTRRGFGASSYAPLKDRADRLGRDVLAVICALKIDKPVLAGHSIAGVELSSVANLDPKTIAGVVYLELLIHTHSTTARAPR